MLPMYSPYSLTNPSTHVTGRPDCAAPAEKGAPRGLTSRPLAADMTADDGASDDQVVQRISETLERTNAMIDHGNTARWEAERRRADERREHMLVAIEDRKRNITEAGMEIRNVSTSALASHSILCAEEKIEKERAQRQRSWEEQAAAFRKAGPCVTS